MASSNISSYSMLNELNITKKDGKIKVRVSRLWDVRNYKNHDSLISLEMVLIDEEGGYVHATIKADFVDKFRSKLTEGGVYIISNFAIEPNKQMYRVVSDSKIMIKFFYNTSVRSVKSDASIIPNHRFDFMSYHALEQRRLKTIDLSDVFGVLVNETKEGDATSIELQDKSKNRIKLKLWGQFSTIYSQQKKDLGHKCQLYFVVVTSTLVKGFTPTSMVLHTTSSTKIYINLDIPEVNELKKHLSENDEQIIVGNVESGSSGDMISKKIDILTIINHCKQPYEKDLYCYCQAEVKEVMSELPWYNPSCPDCKKKPKKGINDFFCDTCNKSIDNPTLVYRLELLVEDNTGTIILTMFDEEAKRWTKQDATTLYDAHANQVDTDDDNDPIPNLLRNIFEGKFFVFKLKVDNYNHSNRRKQTFTILKAQDKSSFEVGKHISETRDKRVLEYISSDDEKDDEKNYEVKNTQKRLKKKLQKT